MTSSHAEILVIENLQALRVQLLANGIMIQRHLEHATLNYSSHHSDMTRVRHYQIMFLLISSTIRISSHNLSFIARLYLLHFAQNWILDLVRARTFTPFFSQPSRLALAEKFGRAMLPGQLDIPLLVFFWHFHKISLNW
jgi:hypothetical protein